MAVKTTRINGTTQADIKLLNENIENLAVEINKLSRLLERVKTALETHTGTKIIS
jgi:hypothetical protein